jgi:hypothetical protein
MQAHNMWYYYSRTVCFETFKLKMSGNYVVSFSIVFIYLKCSYGSEMGNKLTYLNIRDQTQYNDTILDI